MSRPLSRDIRWVDTGRWSSGCGTRSCTGPSVPLHPSAALLMSLGARKVRPAECTPVFARFLRQCVRTGWHHFALASLVSAAAFKGYLGEDMEAWKQYDATELVQKGGYRNNSPILIDVGTADKFLDSQLQPEKFRTAAQSSKVEVRCAVVGVRTWCRSK